MPVTRRPFTNTSSFLTTPVKLYYRRCVLILRPQRSEDDAARMTRQLIDAVHGIGGSYYLPYRPHATVDQFLAG